MRYEIRKATPNDIRPAIDHTPQASIEFDASDCNLMFVALDGEKIVGVIGECGDGHISIVSVDRVYQRQRIATALMSRMVCALKLRGFDKITLNSPPEALPFFKHFGFVPADIEQKLNGFILTPMLYEPNEIWDIYDHNRNKTGRFTERGRAMAAGDYHVVVNVWKYNRAGKWLIDRRADRGMDIDGMWETTGGSAIAGDDSLTAALRETREELGIELDPLKGTLFQSISHVGSDGHGWFQDVWVFEHDCPLDAITLQESETCDAIWATSDKIREMMAAGEFLGYEYYPYFDKMVEDWTGSGRCRD